MSRTIGDVLRIMRLAIGRRNESDPDSNDTTLLQYINDFMSLTMSDDFKLYEQFRTMTFTIDETVTTGIYEYPSTDTSLDFVNISDVMISKSAPVDNSVSWITLELYQNPAEFYAYWGINNTGILISGTPTQVLLHGNEFVFRTIPDQSYLVKMYGYERVGELSEGTDDLPFDYWMRLVAYGAAKQYAADYRLDAEAVNNIERNYARERTLVMTRTHNQSKLNRCIPRF